MRVEFDHSAIASARPVAAPEEIDVPALPDSNVLCPTCDSANVRSAWTGEGVLRMVHCLAPGCMAQWTRSNPARSTSACDDGEPMLGQRHDYATDAAASD